MTSKPALHWKPYDESVPEPPDNMPCLVQISHDDGRHLTTIEGAYDSALRTWFYINVKGKRRALNNSIWVSTYTTFDPFTG